MIIAFKTNNAKFIALNLVFLLLSPTAFAQNAPGTTSATNGQIFLTGPVQNSTVNILQTPNFQVNPGEREVVSGGAAPTAFAQNAPGTTSATNGQIFLTQPVQNSTVNILQTPNFQVNPGEREVVSGGAGSFDINSYILAINYNNAIYAATTACSSGTQAACDGALRTLVAATLARYAGSTLVVLQDNVLLTLRQVVALVRQGSGVAGSRAINIATIDTAFARAFPESTRTRPSSPS